MNLRAKLLRSLLLLLFFMGLTGALHAQRDSLRPRVVLPYDSLALEANSPLPPIDAKAYTYQGDSLPVLRLDSFDNSVLGLQRLRFIAIDTQLNKSDTAVLRVYVIDTKPPRLSLLGNLYITLRQGRTYREPGVTVTDNQDPNPRILYRGTFKDTKKAGLFYIVYQARDTSGNLSDTAIRFIEVVDSARNGIAEELPRQSWFRLSYSDPFSRKLRLWVMDGLKAEAVVFTLQGRLLCRAQVQGEAEIEMTGIAPGAYLLTMACGERRQSTRIILK